MGRAENQVIENREVSLMTLSSGATIKKDVKNEE